MIVSAGHTAASYATIRRRAAQGLTGFTHLSTPCRRSATASPGPVGAALDDRGSWCGLIVDLHHVSGDGLRIAIAAKGWDRMMLITDAMPTVGSDADRVHPARPAGGARRRPAHRRRTARSPAPTSTWRPPCATSCRALGLPLEHALAMASLVPATFLGLDGELGRIAPGYRASLVLLDDGLQVLETWIDGKTG